MLGMFKGPLVFLLKRDKSNFVLDLNWQLESKLFSKLQYLISARCNVLDFVYV
jgi:hypothetical protein